MSRIMNARTRLGGRPTIRHPRIVAGGGRPANRSGNGLGNESGDEGAGRRRAGWYTPLSLVFRKPTDTLQSTPGPDPAVQVNNQTSVSLSPRFTFLLGGRDRMQAVVGRADRQFRSVAAPLAEAGSWSPVDRLLWRNVIEAGSTLTSVSRSRTNESWDVRDISRVERTYRAKLIETAATTTLAPVVSGPVRTQTAAKAIDMDQLDTELWKRFEKRIRVERERRGRG